MSKKILFAIHRLGAGGAEKSLVSLLNSLPISEFNIDLMAIDPTGIFREQIPSQINIVKPPHELICQSVQIKTKLFWHHVNLKTLVLKVWSIVSCRLRSKKSRFEKSHDQFYNDIWRNEIPCYPKQYDIAISYMDCMNYYIIDHVKARKKILWCHNDYNKLEYKSAYDFQYYEKADKVCTISELCKQSLIENFPNIIKGKFEVIENISSKRIINAQAEMLDEMKQSGDGFAQDKRYKIVSIGRLTEQKGFDYAIDAAKILMKKGLNFCWYILGDGPLRISLEEQIKACKVSECVKLIGIRSNPYPYIKQADIFIMSSRYEGKSIALDEAKILCKPIVVTNYPSVYDAIEDGKNGIVAEISAQSIASCILKIHSDKDLRNSLVQNLRKEDCNNEKMVVNKFLSILA